MKKIQIQRVSVFDIVVALVLGVAFTDCANPGESIFKDADKALYKVKQNGGRHGCDFY